MNTAIAIGIKLLEGIFAVGLVGSAVVVVLVTIEDIFDLSRREEPQPTSGD